MVGIIHFREAVKSDIPQLVDLMNSQYARKKGVGYFLWQYFNSYRQSVLYCAFRGEELIGMFGLQKRQLNTCATMGQAIDMLVSKDFRGKGIFKQLAEQAIQYFQDVDLLCVFPNLNGKKASEKSLGWKTLSKISSMCLDSQSIRNISKEDLESLPMSQEEQALTKFVYNTEVREWRFTKHPEYNYFQVQTDGGEFAITKIFTDPTTGKHFGDIVDFECDLNNKTVLTDLYFNACLHLKKQGAESITTWALPHTPLRQVVESLGFTKTAQERYFCVKVLKSKYEYLYDFSFWHLVQADAEIY